MTDDPAPRKLSAQEMLVLLASAQGLVIANLAQALAKCLHLDPAVLASLMGAQALTHRDQDVALMATRMQAAVLMALRSAEPPAGRA